ncbi:hypothetical protein [Massilia sp. TS11]|uniref:hypothetical protein n=1 Tax=Massilia sp. TS11 TaxID=2908003 RepID=UPI001EDB2C9B|nr:hypothetical protein [Massilia sp. TS11]MCG2583493.1 hypothetical protein [Massilia sp. TS11]
MSKLYHQLALAELRPGMVLSDEVQDNNGAILLAAGTVLTVPMIASLARHQVHTVAVVQDPPADGAAPEAADAEGHAVMETRLAHLFRKHDPDADMDWATGILWRYLTDFRTEKAPEQ